MQGGHNKAIMDIKLCPSLQFAAVVYNDKVKQHWHHMANMMEILTTFFSTMPMSMLLTLHTIRIY